MTIKYLNEDVLEALVLDYFSAAQSAFDENIYHSRGTNIDSLATYRLKVLAKKEHELRCAVPGTRQNRR